MCFPFYHYFFSFDLVAESNSLDEEIHLICYYFTVN